MWAIIFLSLIIGAAAGFFYLISRFYRFAYVKRIARGNKPVRAVTAAASVLVITAAVWFSLGSVNAVVCVLHLVVFWLFCDFVFRLAEKKRGRAFQRYYAGALAIAVTICYLCVGWVLAHHVWRTAYTIETEKEVGELRIVQFADSHVGTTFHAEGLAEYVAQMQEENPDIVVITGDFVDDDTTKEDMIGSCRALGALQATYGVYYVFGNHDKGYYGEDYRGYSGADLIAELEKNGVTVLQDEAVLIDDRFYIVGRQDRSEEQTGNGRASVAELVQGLDKSKFIIVLDHQPCEYKLEEEAGADLVLSGHTHGGQLFPAGFIGEWIGANDKTYGLEKRGGTHFLVTSGISDWAIKFKTGCKSEYVVIDVKERKNE